MRNRTRQAELRDVARGGLPGFWREKIWWGMTRVLLLMVLASGIGSVEVGAGVAGHPRLWVRGEDLSRLRSWARQDNPVYVALTELAAEWKMDMDGRPAQEGVPAEPSRVPSEDTGDWQPETYATEKYAQLFAFMSLISPEATVREDYARRARTLLMHVMDRAVLGVAEGVPFRRAGFFTEDSNRARALGEAFPLTVDWIYPSLSAADKATIRTVFLRWSREIVDAGYHHPEPVGVVNDRRLIADRLAVRWSCNNYYTAFTRTLGLMGMALDREDDAGGKLGESLRIATGSWLYVLDELMRTDCAGGMFAEGEEYSPASTGYLAQFMWALETAGEDDAARWGRQVRWENNPFWEELLPAYFNSITPGQRVNPAYDYLGPVYETASYGDQEEYFPRDRIALLGPLGLHARRVGNMDRWAAIRWAQEHLQPGGSGNLTTRVRDSNTSTHGIFYFLLFDPTTPPVVDMRSRFPKTHYAPGIGRLLTRTSWGADATWFTHKLSWTGIDHLNGDGNQFEFYRRGEWLTKERAGYDLDAGSSDNHNTLAIQNDDPGRDPEDYRSIEWVRGSQFLYVAGDPTMLARSENERYAYALGDATALYNYPEANVVDVTHASRSIVWLKPDHIVVYDRAATGKEGRFKRFWLNLPASAEVNGDRARMTTATGQRLYVRTLLPTGAVPTVERNPDTPIRGDVAKGEPMLYRMRVEAPGHPRSARFMHVLQGTDAGVGADETELIRSSAGTEYDGAVVGTVAVLFPVQVTTPFSAVTYAVPERVRTHLVTGLVPGGAYSVDRARVGLNETVTVRVGGIERADSGGVLTIERRTSSVHTIKLSVLGRTVNLRIEGENLGSVRVQSSKDLRTWLELGTVRAEASGDYNFGAVAVESGNTEARFYRALSP